MIEAELPDGRILEFPDGTDPAVIQRTVKQALGVQAQPAALVDPAVPPIPDPVQPPLTERQASNIPEIIQDFLRFREGGGVSSLLGMEDTPPIGEQSPRDIAMGFAGPGAIRSVGAAARPLFQGLRNLRKPVPKAPSFDELKALSGEAYDIADNAGLLISNQSYGRSVQDLGKKLIDAGIDRTLHPKATRAFERLAEEVPQDLPLRKFETLRRVAKDAASSPDASERRIAKIITNHLDDYLEGIGKTDVVAGDPDLASKALTRARSLWSRAKKGEEIEELIERAQESASQFSGSGLENALTTQFRALAKNPKKMRLFTPQEQAAIRKVNRGGPTTNILRMLGKFAPTGVVSSVLSGGAGAALGGGPGAVALPAAGLAARKGAQALTSKAAREASELMRRGGPPQATPRTRAPVSRGQGLIFGDIPGIEPFPEEQRRR